MCLELTCLERGLCRRHLSACSLHLSEAFWLVQGRELGDRPDALPRKLVKRRRIKVKECERNAYVYTHSVTERGVRFMKLLPSL